MAGRGYLISRLAKANIKQNVDEDLTKPQYDNSNGHITKVPVPNIYNESNGTIIESIPKVPRGRRAIFDKMAKKSELNQNLTSKFLKNSHDLTVQNLPVSPICKNDKINILPKPTTEHQEQSITNLQQLSIPIETLKIEKAPVINRVPKNSVNNNYHMAELSSNYINIKLNENIGVYEYLVTFNPPIDVMQARFYLLNGQKETFPVKTFDGTMLFLPAKLPQNITTLMGNLKDGSEVTMTIKFLKKKTTCDSTQFYNILFHSILKTLGLIEFGRHFFELEKMIFIPDYNIEIWPGYITTVENFENGIYLCCDVSHRILRRQTTLEIIIEISHSRQLNGNVKENVMSKLCGSTVITRYNNKTYRIDDIDFSINPSSTFNHNGTDISYIDYYKKMYDIEIKDHNQPMIITIAKKNKFGTNKDSNICCLVPELSYLTGLTEEMKSDYKLMKAIHTHTNITPDMRQCTLVDFVNRINNHEKASMKLKNWGLTLCPNPVELNGPIYKRESIVFGNKVRKPVGTNMEWGLDVTNNQMFKAVHLTNWFLLYTTKDLTTAKSFCNQLAICGKPIGMNISSPIDVTVPGTKPECYVSTLNRIIMSNPELQLLVIIVPNQREDRYNAIKRICCVENGIPSQIIISRTLSRPDKLRSITQKIALQINCKMGGAGWAIDIPLRNTIIIGIDTYHEKNKNISSVTGIVASMNKTYSEWYSVAAIQKCTLQEVMKNIHLAFHKVLNQFKLKNGSLPEKIIIYRDGVSHGNFVEVETIELGNLEESFQKYSSNYNPMVTYIIVQKRINTRVFQFIDKKYSNPMPGTVIDNTITTRNYFDFFLVSQQVRQGTVNPTHYIVLKNGCNLTTENVQRLSYKLCHLYYNWCGTIKVPAPIQYAHKLAYLVGQNIRQLPNEKLTDSLFFL